MVANNDDVKNNLFRDEKSHITVEVEMNDETVAVLCEKLNLIHPKVFEDFQSLGLNPNDEKSLIARMRFLCIDHLSDIMRNSIQVYCQNVINSTVSQSLN